MKWFLISPQYHLPVLIPAFHGELRDRQDPGVRDLRFTTTPFVTGSSFHYDTTERMIQAFQKQTSHSGADYYVILLYLEKMIQYDN